MTLDHLREIGGEMVDELVDGIRARCAAAPDPLLDPERQFFRTLASGLAGMSDVEVLALCAAAITRIAYPDLRIRAARRGTAAEDD